MTTSENWRYVNLVCMPYTSLFIDRIDGLEIIKFHVQQKVFDTFYRALKRRQLIVYSGIMKDYAKKFKIGDLDKFKKVNEDEYTHLLQSVWKDSTYDSKLRELKQEELELYNERAKFIEESDEV